MLVMKHTKIAGFVLGLWLILINLTDAWALVPLREVDDLLIKPTATPTSKIILQKIIDPNLIKVLTTSTPTSVPPTVTVTSAPTVTPTVAEPTKEPTGEVLSEQVEPTSEPTPTETVAPTSTTTPTNTQNNMTMWFLIVTVGLLAAIIVIQAWPRKEKEEDSN